MGILENLAGAVRGPGPPGGGATNQLVGGRLAVQLFYVISGFLISYVLTGTDRYQGATGTSTPTGCYACFRSTWRSLR